MLKDKAFLIFHIIFHEQFSIKQHFKDIKKYSNPMYKNVEIP